MTDMKHLKKSVEAAIKKGLADRKGTKKQKDAAAEVRLQAALAELPSTVYAATLAGRRALVMILEPEDTVMNGIYTSHLERKDLRGAGAKMFAICNDLGLTPLLSGIGFGGKSYIAIQMSGRV